MSEYRQYPAPASRGRHAQQPAPRAVAPQSRTGASSGAYRPSAAQPSGIRPIQPGQGNRRQQGPEKKGGPWRVVFWVALAVFVVALIALAAIGFSYWQGQQTYHEVAEEGFAPPDDIEGTSLSDLTVDWDALRAINPETVGWIYIPGTVVNYPIVQTTDDEKYLKQDFKGSVGWIAMFGAIFLSADNSADFSDANNIIYGHHMNDGSMFSCLADFGDPAQFDDHRTVYLLTPAGNYRLSTFALVHVAADDPLVQTRFSDAAERTAYAQDKIDRSVVSVSDIPAAADIDRMFALATCDNLPTNGRYVLYASIAETTVGTNAPDAGMTDPDAVRAVGEAGEEIAS